MCGIGGCYKKDGIQADDVHLILEMAKRSVDRGRDATGFMIPNGWWKIAQRSPMAVENSGLADWLQENRVWDGDHKWLMFHTRAMTRGSPRISANNHPMVHGRDEYGVKLIHNGVIKSPNYYSYQVVDTRSLAYLMNRLRKEGMSLLQATRSAVVSLEGRAAICVTDRYGKEFVIMKDANEGRSPLFYYWNKRDDRLQWSSTKAIAGDSFIGDVGRKVGNTVAYELNHWQCLWWNGEDNTPLVRIWDKEKHGGDPLKMRLPLPPKLKLRDYRPKTFDDGGKFALNYQYANRQPKKVRPAPTTTSTFNNTKQTQLSEYIEVSDWYREDPVTNIVIYPTIVPDVGAFPKHDNWYGFTDRGWALKLRTALVQLEKNGEFVSIMRHDSQAHIMYVLLSDNHTRKYFRTKKKGKLAFVDIGA